MRSIGSGILAHYPPDGRSSHGGRGVELALFELALFELALQWPMRQMTVLALTDEAVHQHEIANGPPNRLDRSLRDHMLVIEQRHVRGEMHAHPAAEADPHHGSAKRTVEVNEGREIVARPQHKRLIPALAIETHHAIEHDIELRHLDR